MWLLSLTSISRKKITFDYPQSVHMCIFIHKQAPVEETALFSVLQISCLTSLCTYLPSNLRSHSNISVTGPKIVLPSATFSHTYLLAKACVGNGVCQITTANYQKMGECMISFHQSYMQLTSQLLICVQTLYSVCSPLYVI